jgi:sugar lactone lactonase YvrE
MFKKASLTLLGLGALYLLAWPVPIEPRPWNAPQNQGYTGDYAPNTGLEDLELITLNGEYGPEDAAEGPEGRIFMASHSGAILAYDPSTGTTTEFANTGGLPLGVSATVDGTLYIADAAKGLLRIDVDGAVTVLTDSFGGAPITYADDLDIAPDGSIYFTDASTKFGAVAHGGAFPASFLDLMEHGGHGRVLRYNPATDETTLILYGLQFANGLAMNAAGTHFLVNETGDYSIKRVSLDGAEVETIVENTPGFPDNIARAQDGTFWFGLISPRSDAADGLSDKPFLRKIVMRLPEALRPKATRYGLVARIDENGTVLETLHGAAGEFAYVTGLIEARDGTRYLTSLRESHLGMIAPE